MSRRNAEILLAAVIVARSTSLLFAKVGLSSISPLNLLGVRFCLAFFVLAILFARRLAKVTAENLLCGMFLGGSFFAVMVAEMFALKATDASTTSFLENTAIVIVPLLEAFLHRRKPNARILFSAVITLVGVAFLTLREGMGIGMGELLCILTALLYASSIILTDRLSHRGDPFLLGILQVGFMGVFSLAASFLFEQPRMPQNSTEWMVILMLALVCSCFGFTLQPVAQKYSSSARAAQFCALNPLSVVILSALFLDERLGLYGLIGAALILAGIAIQSGRQQEAA